MKHVGTGAGARAVRQKMLLNPYLTSILNNNSCPNTDIQNNANYKNKIFRTNY